MQGTPLGDTGIEPPSGLDLVRCIATARVVMPATVVRLSAGRLNLSIADQVGSCDSCSRGLQLCRACLHISSYPLCENKREMVFLWFRP